MISRQWQASPVTITVDTVTGDVADVNFPAISVCQPGAALRQNLKMYVIKCIFFKTWSLPFIFFNRFLKKYEEGETLDEMDLNHREKLTGWKNNISLIEFVKYMYNDFDVIAELQLFDQNGKTET